MKKGNKNRHFSHKGSDKALLASLATALFLKERIKTTSAKAKEVAPFAEKLISKAKEDSLTSLRFLKRFLPDKAIEKLREEAKRYEKRAGGYTRIIRLEPRLSDGAKMVFIELVK